MMYGSTISNLLTGIADAGREFLNRQAGRTGAETRLLEKPMADSCRELLTSIGEASGTALAREVVETFGPMQWEEKLHFFETLKMVFSPDPVVVSAAIDAYQSEPSELNLQQMAAKIEAPRQELFRRLNMAPGGTAALVHLRSDLLGAIKLDPDLKVVDADLRHLLSSWFNRGFLELQRIDWRTPAIVLEKLIAYEAVHEIRGWDDLQRRLTADRRCYGFFHPALPEEPLVFVQVALVNGISAQVQPLIDLNSEPSRPQDADTAIFYSISNCQNGLRGISFGNFLIKQVVAEMRRELPNIKTFSTLSPIPGFMKWLDQAIEANEIKEPRIDNRPLRRVLTEPDWFENVKLAVKAKPKLLALCAQYLVLAKTRERPADPVARFHLNNGARLERINWLGDISEHGLKQSAGMMVNYLYRPDDIIRNHEAFAHKGKIITSTGVVDLVKQSQPKTGKRLKLEPGL